LEQKKDRKQQSSKVHIMLMAGSNSYTTDLWWNGKY